MHCIFVSNCDHKALKKTRALLDRYAQRIGDRAWASRITEAALNEVNLALRRQATRQTSVACYRNDPLFGVRLVWIVGNSKAYDKNGWFAVATKQRKENYPLIFRHAALIARLAGYAHDLGKASKHFQDKLYKSTLSTPQNGFSGDFIRHEWLSTWLLDFITKEEVDFTIAGLVDAWGEMQKKEGKADGPSSISNLSVGSLNEGMSAVLFGVCTHHGAFGGQLGILDGSAHIGGRGSDPGQTAELLALAVDPAKCKKDGQRWQEVMTKMSKLRDRIKRIERPPEYWEGVMLVARAALILADHKISSQKFKGLREEGILFANTKKNPEQKVFSKGHKRNLRTKQANPRYFDQPLSWHLLQVGDLAAHNIRMFTGEDMPVLDQEICKELMERCNDPTSKFLWQDYATEAVKTKGGKLIFNVASTGAGKTLANLKMIVAARDGKDIRVAVAFNLRSLTTQTFSAFKSHLKSVDEKSFERDFTCLIGEHGAIKVDFSREDEDDIDEQTPVELIGSDRLLLPEWLNNIAKEDEKDSTSIKLLASPVLVSTMDWIVASGEPGQQAKHAKAMIRVATSDLILDEVDSYDVDATVAVMRVVKTAAMFGRNVVISSATLNPALAEGLITAFSSGRKIYESLFGADDWALVIVSDLIKPTSIIKPTKKTGSLFYRDCLKEMVVELDKRPVTKRFGIAPTLTVNNISAEKVFSNTIVDSAWSLHKQQAKHYPGLPEDCRLSFGLVRVANVKPCINSAEALLEDGRFIVSAYHANDIFERRAYKEKYLDEVLSRKPEVTNWLTSLLIREPWLKTARGDVCFVLVATPVEEVGRDHDFDWAVIEPSSMHSIIQTAGRVNRHRQDQLLPDQINILILDKNLKTLKGETRVFEKPGLEIADRAGKVSTHPSHDMSQLLLTKKGIIADRLDAGMIFDFEHRKTLFADCDEIAIKKKTDLVLEAIEQTQGHETDFLLKTFVSEFPLRSGPQDRVMVIDPNHKVFSIEPEISKAGDFLMETNPKNVWATLDKLDSEVRAPLKYKKNPVRVSAKWNCLEAS